MSTMGYDTLAAAGSATADVSVASASDGKVAVGAASVDASTVAETVSFAGADDAAQADSGEAGAVPHIGRLLIENGLLTYRDGVSGETTKVRLTSVEAEAASADDPLHLNVQAAFNDMAVKLNGTLGPLKNAMAPGEPLQLDLTAEGLGLTAKVKGSAQAADGALDARIEISAADLSGVRALAGDALPANVGFTHALLAPNPSPDGRLQETRVDNLRVLATGPLPPNPSELLGSLRMRELVEELKTQADVLIFDSPPCLPATDAAVLSSLMDGVLLVVDAGVTRRGAARQALESLQKVGQLRCGVRGLACP